MDQPLTPFELEQLAVLRREAAGQRACAWRSVLQLASCLIPCVGLWVAMLAAGLERWWLTVALACACGAFLVRLFGSFHDLAHGSLFARRGLNELLGVLVGVVMLTPYHRWRRDHGRHHAAVGNLDRRGPGDVPLFTVDEYLQAPWWPRLQYRVFRWPVFTFVGGGLLLFVVLMRRPGDGSRRERLAVHATTLACAGLLYLAYHALGPLLFLATVVPMYTVLCSCTLWLYNLQHMYPGAYLRRASQWDYTRACLEGSAYYRLPRVLQWLTTNTGLHHLHHLFPHVPNYFLPRCQAALLRLGLGHRAPPLTLRASLQVMHWGVFDERRAEFVPLPRRRAAAPLPWASPMPDRDDDPEAGLLDALHDLVDVSEAFGVHAPSQAEQQRLRDKAAAVRERVAVLSERTGGTPTSEHAQLLVRVDALVVQLGPGHDAASWRGARAPLVDAYEQLRFASGDRPGARPRAKPHNVARTAFHVLSGVMWAFVYEHVLERGPLLWVLSGFLVFFLTDDAMRRWFPDHRSGFAVVVFRMLSRASEAAGIASSTWYTLGLMVGVAFLPKPACLMGLLILAFADPAAGFVGRRWGGPRLYRDKSLGGTAAFFVVAFAIAVATLALAVPALGVGPRLGVAAVIALIGSVAELLGDHVADNFSILVVTGTAAALVL